MISWSAGKSVLNMACRTAGCTRWAKDLPERERERERRVGERDRERGVGESQGGKEG
jgi:hypothetical protein